VDARLPPGPGPIATFGFLRRPFEFLDACARRYGDWFTLRVPGIPPFVFTSDPVAIREVFRGDPECLRAGEANASLGPFFGPHSVLLMDGAQHLHERRILGPPLHGDRMKAYGPLMRRAADEAIDAWPSGRPFPLHPSMQAITFEVIVRAVFGFDDGPAFGRLRATLTRLFRLFASPGAMLIGLPALQRDLGPWSPWGRLVRLRRELDALFSAELARRRAAGVDARDDVLSLLLAARDEDGRAPSDAALRDEMVTLLLAGHETTAASLSWVVHRLIQRPDVLAEVRRELDAGGEDADTRYLEAVINESARLEPVVPNVGRRLREPATIAAHALPAGVVIAPCIYLTHRRPDLWPDPLRFAPERFLGARPLPHAFIPFGGGVRRCLGAALASHEMKVVLARMVARVDLRLVPGYRARAVRRSIAFAPAHGLPVTATTRA
jgi:cytochrome P450